MTGRLRLAFCKAEGCLHISEQARASGMQNPSLYVLKFPSVPLEKSINESADSLTDHFRNIFGEQDVETRIAEVEAHGAQRIGKREGFRPHDFGAVQFLPCTPHSAAP